MELSVDKNGEYLIKNFRLVKARERVGLSQLDLAKQAGLIGITYSTYERMRSKPQREQKIRIARVLGQSIESLFPKSIEKHYKTRVKSEDIYDNYEKISFDFKKISQEPDTNKSIDKIDLAIAVDSLLDELTPRQKNVLKLRAQEYSLEEIGETYGLSRERIRQIESEAIRKLKHPSRSKLLREFYLDIYS